MSGWQEILARVFDGESVSADDAAELQAALLVDENWQHARRWMQSEMTLRDCLHTHHDDVLELSRDRLLARVILREKHARILSEPMLTGADPSGAEKERSPNSVTPIRPTVTPSVGSGPWLQVVAVTAIVLIMAVAFWPDSSSRSYAAPRADGDFRVLGAVDPIVRKGIERGDRIVSAGQQARIELGSYCRLVMDAHTDVTIHGAPYREVVELHQGRLHARVTPDHGGFVIRTPLGPVTVKGTEFETIVEYPNGMPGDRSMNRVKKVLVTVAVMSGVVLCELGDGPVLLESGAGQAFAGDIESRKTSGEVTSCSNSEVILKDAEGQSQTFHVTENKLTVHEASELLKGDKVTIAWDEDGGRRWIRDIEGEGILEGKVTALGDAWIELQTGDRKVKLRAPWRGGNPSDGGGPDREVVRKLGQLRVGDEVAVTWAMPEGKRVMDVRQRKPTDLTKAPPQLHGLSGRVIGRLVSKDVEKGELTLKIAKVDKVWRNNKASDPKSAEGRTLKIDNVFGKFLDVLLTLKEGDGVQIEVKHVRGDGLTFLGEDLKKVEIQEEMTSERKDRTVEDQSDDDSPEGLQGFRGILIGELVSKDVEKGTLVFKMEKVQRVWKANRAPAPEKSKGKLISVEGISGKFLDTLLILDIGTRIEVEAFQVRGKTLQFPGEWLKKADQK